MNNFGYSARWRDLLSVGFLSFLLIAALFPFVLAHPNDYFFLTGGDALQSHYATAFYALHDHGVRFTGMNYPYGEHFNYPNLQPLIALVMNWLQQAGIPAARHTVAITNLVALLGVMVTPVVLFSILRRLSLPVGYAMLMALLIGYLSPQIDRLGGHMSLSYTCFVPMLWYCIIRMQENPYQWRWYILFGIGSILMGLVMLYFLACGSFFLLGHIAVLYWRQPRAWVLLRRMLLAALLPLLLFRGWLWLTDTVADRPPNPYGLFTYVATPLSVFSPILPPCATGGRPFFIRQIRILRGGAMWVL
ncbi:hypothetical protein MUN82_17540 [Hymenobacter aerilatus]|uniref:DUF6311 domain-containing protein n=1 Tax=Hymenobacter aerilatus TaxID=2932251 RepID=A0A8T9SY83_9BACT|nr:hypothetical protein [Hymenobacter aerilatus]UOR04739.1 hypothetical protein MUN82_17540 [Hymenobacter aerilatus]